MWISGLQLMETVSIHAPVKGATSNMDTYRSHRTSFNPRPREGGDPFMTPELTGFDEFQSTPP